MSVAARRIYCLLALLALSACAHGPPTPLGYPAQQGVYECDPDTGAPLHGLRALGAGPRPPGTNTRQGLRPGAIRALLPSRGTIAYGTHGFGPCTPQP